ncbi:hypothetical protein M0812_22654 [Anaeramoeba flamelloides]|uniref:Uncharacterized protein n=1 Tax=Anaeramoeba flamelloides TaxID=1746091 RepID=A0AAV7Z244_9EUKA|nr:hypothetical protein M0812_22654 [Anaeramoeba flamelloides]
MIAIPTRKRIFVPISETDEFNKNEFNPNKTPRNLSNPNKVIGNKPTRINHPTNRQIEQRKKKKENKNLNPNNFSMKENFTHHQQYNSKFSKYLDRNESKLHQQNQRLLNNHFYPTYRSEDLKKEPLYTTLEVKSILAKVYKEFTKEKQKQYQDLLNQRYSEQLRIFTITNQQTTGEQKINSASYIN